MLGGGMGTWVCGRRVGEGVVVTLFHVKHVGPDMR